MYIDVGLHKVESMDGNVQCLSKALQMHSLLAGCFSKTLDLDVQPIGKILSVLFGCYWWQSRMTAVCHTTCAGIA